jgi:hypothetical protein
MRPCAPPTCPSRPNKSVYCTERMITSPLNHQEPVLTQPITSLMMCPTFPQPTPLMERFKRLSLPSKKPNLLRSQDSHIEGSTTSVCLTESLHSEASRQPLNSCIRIASQHESVLSTYPAPATREASAATESRTVSFGDVSIHSHERILGDNPAVR